MNAIQLISYYKDEGYTTQEIIDFLCDGEALAKEGITDTEIVEEAFSILVG